MDLQISYLQGEFGIYANLSGANLYGANLSRADLSRANLSDANLSDADLSGADLSRANLSGANLYGADLSGANLSDANLSDANLSDANLSGVNLYGANLSRADLSRADLSGADLSRAKLPFYKIAPPSGAFIAWKKGGNGEIIKLRIPWFSRRCSSLVGRKCRTELAIVESIERKGKPIESCQCWNSYYNFQYHVGKFARALDYDPDPRIECTSGIHFFITREEAETWSM